MKLTEEQSQVVADNHNLIYWYAHKAHLNLDAWYDLLTIELCYSVLKHDPEKSVLSTFFKLRCDWLVCKEYRKTNSKKRFCESIQYIDDVGYTDLLKVKDHLTPIEETLEFAELVAVENGIVLRMKYEGYSQMEIAKQLGVSQSYVSKILRKLKDDYEVDRQTKS